MESQPSLDRFWTATKHGLVYGRWEAEPWLELRRSQCKKWRKELRWWFPIGEWSRREKWKSPVREPTWWSRCKRFSRMEFHGKALAKATQKFFHKVEARQACKSCKVWSTFCSLELTRDCRRLRWWSAGRQQNRKSLRQLLLRQLHQFCERF